MKRRFEAGVLAWGLAAMLLWPGAARAEEQAPVEAPWPPAMPGAVNGTVTISSEVFLEIPEEVRELAEADEAVSFVVAEAPPTVELAYHGDLPYAILGRTGWSSWGDIGVADDGRVYSGIGDHAFDDQGRANAFIYEWDPRSGRLTKVVDINAAAGRTGDEPAFAKVHARVDQGADGGIYFSGTLNSGQGAGDEKFKWSENLPGGQLYRYDPESGETTVVANLPERRVTATSLLDRERNVWWCNLEAGEGDALYAIDLDSGEPVYQSDDGVVSHNRNFAVTRDGSVIFNGEGGFWRWNPETSDIEQTGSTLPDDHHMRASTRESSDGWIYGVTGRPGTVFRYHPGDDELEMLGHDFLTGDYTTVAVLSPDERFVYYLPGAHGQARAIGTPVIQYEIETGQRKVIAFLLEAIQQEIDYVVAGTYGVKMNEDGSTLYVNFNGHAGDSHRLEPMPDNGFGLTSFAAIHIPESER